MTASKPRWDVDGKTFRSRRCQPRPQRNLSLRRPRPADVPSLPVALVIVTNGCCHRPTCCNILDRPFLTFAPTPTPNRTRLSLRPTPNSPTMTAFVVSASAFTPAATPTRGTFAGAAISTTRPAGGATTPTMIDPLAKYNKMSGGEATAAVAAAPAPGPSAMSGGYRAYLNGVAAAKGDSYRSTKKAAKGGPTPGYSTNALLAGGSPFFYLQGSASAAKFGKGGDATTDVVPKGRVGAAADKYMAGCVRTQYKATAVPTGVVRWLGSARERGVVERGLKVESRCESSTELFLQLLSWCECGQPRSTVLLTGPYHMPSGAPFSVCLS